MTLTRIVVVLAGTLLVLLTCVVLRADAASMNDRLAALESEAGELWQELRAKELELARLRTPSVIRERVSSQRMKAAPADNSRKPGAP